MGSLRTLIAWNDGANTMSFDAILRENYSRTAEVTSFPVEGGAVISDHVQPNQTQITLEVHVSDTPVNVAADHLGDNIVGERGENSTNSDGTGFKDFLDRHPLPPVTPSAPSGRLIRNLAANAQGRKTKSVSVLLFTGGKPNRVVNIFDQLEKFLIEGEVLTIKTKLRTFENMVMKTLEAQRDATSGSGLAFTIDLVQIEIVDSEVTGGSKKAPVNKGNRGKEKAGGETEAVPPEQKTSLTAQARNALLDRLAPIGG